MKLDSGNGLLKILKLEERGSRRYIKFLVVMFEIFELDKIIIVGFLYGNMCFLMSGIIC